MIEQSQSLKIPTTVPLESSVFTAVAYRAGSQQLYLRFQEGNVYRYFSCPRSVYKELLAAESKGWYFAQHAAQYLNPRRPIPDFVQASIGPVYALQNERLLNNRVPHP